MNRDLTEQEKQDTLAFEPDFKLIGMIDLEKSTNDNEAKRIVWGEISNPDKDEQGESLIQKSLDFSYFDEMGVIKYEHTPRNSPSNIIGFPHFRNTEDQGTVIKGALLKGHKMADDTWSLIQAIEKHNKEFPKNQKTLGWSVEGKYGTRRHGNHLVKSAKIYNVVITPNPVLKSTYLKTMEENNMSILKSLAATPVNTDLSAKVGGDAIVSENIDGKVKNTTENKKKKKQKKENFVMKSFNTHDEAVEHFLNQGLDAEQAELMAKSLDIEDANVNDPEGENSEELRGIKKSLSKLTDFIKSLKDDKNLDDDLIGDDIDKNISIDKSINNDLGDDENEVDVTEFLENIGDDLSLIKKSLIGKENQTEVIAKSLESVCNAFDSVNTRMENIEKSLTIEGHSVGEAVRVLMKSRSGMSVADLQKFKILDNQGGNTSINNFGELSALLEKSVDSNKITFDEQSKAESAYRLNDTGTLNEILEKCNRK